MLRIIAVPPISLRKTKVLIERSLRIYLTGRQATLRAVRNGENVSARLERSEDFSTPPAVTSAVPDTPPIYSSSPPIHKDGFEAAWRFPDPTTRVDSNPNSISSNQLPFPTARQRASSETAVERLPNRPPPVPPKDDIRPKKVSIPTRKPVNTTGRKIDDSPASNDRGRRSEGCQDTSKKIFPELDDYLATSFASYDCLNSSFSTVKVAPTVVTNSKIQGSAHPRSNEIIFESDQSAFANLDEKTLLIGDFAENGSWWTGGREKQKAISANKEICHGLPEKSDPLSDLVSIKTPRIDWIEVGEFYQTLLRIESSWKSTWEEIISDDFSPPDEELSALYDAEETRIEQEIHEACLRTQRTFLKATETLLKRPGRPLKHPFEIRFLLIIMSNPLLQQINIHKSPDESDSRKSNQGTSRIDVSGQPRAGSHRTKSGPGQHSGIIKRILGIMSNLPNECHCHIVSWFSRLSESHFKRTVELVGSFVTYRLTQQHGRRRSNEIDPTAGLVPSLDTPGAESSARLHAALGVVGPSKPSVKVDDDPIIYSEDWRIKAAAKVMALLFSANSNAIVQRTGRERQQVAERTPLGAGRAAQLRAHSHGQMLLTSDFYNTLLDYSDLVADFEAWEKRKAKFAFCQYPFFLSIWAKIHILEYDARRQMEVRAREAFFNSIMNRKAIPQYLVLRVRRDCLVEDSLQGVSEVIGAGEEEIKKGLRIDFIGEEGIDAGGLRKEWFLLLVRDIFDPNHGTYSRRLLLFLADGLRTFHLR
jgi:E3 ubiquitin-protein ligase HECTD2